MCKNSDSSTKQFFKCHHPIKNKYILTNFFTDTWKLHNRSAYINLYFILFFLYAVYKLKSGHTLSDKYRTVEQPPTTNCNPNMHNHIRVTEASEVVQIGRYQPFLCSSISNRWFQYVINRLQKCGRCIFTNKTDSCK